MHSSGSMIKTFCELTRFYCDLPDVDAKYNNDYLVNYLMGRSLSNVLGRVSGTLGCPILQRFSVSLVDGTERYYLPPDIQQIWRLAIIDSEGRITHDAKPRGQFSPRGPGWSIEGNMLAVRPFPEVDQTVDIWYTSAGNIRSHYHATGGTLAAGEWSINTAASGMTGSVDLRPNAYAGMHLRVLGTSHEERIIASHDQPNGKVTPSLTFTNAYGANTPYEILPYAIMPMMDATSCLAAHSLATSMKASQAHKGSILLEYKQAMKTALDNMSGIMGRISHRFDSDTIDNPNWDEPLVAVTL